MNPPGDSPETPPAAPPPKRKPKPPAPSNSPNWKFWLSYGMLTLLLLWIWQDSLQQMVLRNMPYGEFKQRLALGQVKSCDIGETEITGRMVIPADAPPLPKAEDKQSAKDASKAEPTKAASTKTEPTKAEPTKSAAPAAGDAPGGATKAAEGPSQTTTTKTTTTVDSKTAPAAKSETKTSTDKSVESKKTDDPKKDEAKDKKDEPDDFRFRTIRVEDPKLVEALEQAGVDFEGTRPSLLSQLLFSWMLPIAVMVGLWWIISSRMRSAGESVMSFSKNKSKLVADQETGVSFNDVAGCDEAKAELQEVVDFLKNPSRYEAMGAKIPKGVLLVGPPGTGKTLLARAVAGEAHVPFYSISGSDFVEMFVGVGAARVRDLFQQAKQSAPCIIFIDEMDAIGRQRGVHVGAVNDEREQTLNQMLVEMDGFEANAGVILLAATNRPDVLDRALLRPGRFDRQVVVDAPDVDGREAILKVHTRNKRLDADADLRKIAQSTPGFSGADLANAVNEAALLAVKRDHKTIKQRDLEDSLEKVVAGPERKSRRLMPDEKRRVAYHEVGHALVAAYSEHADPVHKISIVPRGRAALGYTMQLPTEDRFLMSRAELLDQIRGMLGGRAAEEIVFGEISTGASNDLERATSLARQMVCMYGMSDVVGLVNCGHQGGSPFLMGPNMGLQQSDCSPQTSREIDLEVRQMLNDCYQQARTVLADHREDLERVTQELLRKETLDSTEFQLLLHPDEAAPVEAT